MIKDYFRKSGLVLAAELPDGNTRGVEMFDTDFELFLANDMNSASAHHRVRYKVFCQERGFENASVFTDHQEKDQWDEHAVRFVVGDRSSNQWVGAYRLILGDRDSFPVEALACGLPEIARDIPRHEIAEISRFCVVKSAESSPTWRDRLTGMADVGFVARPQENVVNLGLIRGAIYYGLNNNINYMYMLITKAFHRLLSRIGVVFVGEGTAVEHRGQRTPYLVDVAATRIRMAERSEKIAAMLSREHLAYQQPTQMPAAEPAFGGAWALQPLLIS